MWCRFVCVDVCFRICSVWVYIFYCERDLLTTYTYTLFEFEVYRSNKTFLSFVMQIDAYTVIHHCLRTCRFRITGRRFCFWLPLNNWSNTGILNILVLLASSFIYCDLRGGWGSTLLWPQLLFALYFWREVVVISQLQLQTISNHIIYIFTHAYYIYLEMCMYLHVPVFRVPPTNGTVSAPYCSW